MEGISKGPHKTAQFYATQKFIELDNICSWVKTHLQKYSRKQQVFQYTYFHPSYLAASHLFCLKFNYSNQIKSQIQRLKALGLFGSFFHYSISNSKLDNSLDSSVSSFEYTYIKYTHTKQNSLVWKGP